MDTDQANTPDPMVAVGRKRNFRDATKTHSELNKTCSSARSSAGWSKRSTFWVSDVISDGSVGGDGIHGHGRLGRAAAVLGGQLYSIDSSASLFYENVVPASTRNRHALRSAFDGLPVLESEGAIFEAARRPRSLVTNFAFARVPEDTQYACKTY